MKYFRRRNFPWNEQICSGAVSVCNFEILKYAHEKGCPWDGDTFFQAVICEKINRNNPIILDKIIPIITYLYVNMCPLHYRINIFLEPNDYMYDIQYRLNDDHDLSEDDDMDMHSDFCLITYHENNEYDESNDYFHDFENTYENENTNVYETAMKYEEKYYRCY